MAIPTITVPNRVDLGPALKAKPLFIGTAWGLRVDTCYADLTWWAVKQTFTMAIDSCSILFIPAGAFSGGYLANVVGRKKGLIIGGITHLATYLLLTFATNLAMLYIARFMVETCVCFMMVVGTMYIAEIAWVLRHFKKSKDVFHFVPVNFRSRWSYYGGTFIKKYMMLCNEKD